MKFQTVCAVALGAAASLSFASMAAAQAPAAASPYGLSGNAPGVCIVSSASVLGESAVGRSIEARMKQLVATVTSEISGEQTAIDAEKRSIETAAKTATTAAQQAPLQTRAQALQARFDALQRKAQQRDSELRETQAKAVARVGDAARPLIRQVANQKSCAIVFDNNTIADANPTMDITAAVIQRLDATLPSITFERERLDTAAAAPQTR